jgi:hypothetical protein
MGKVRESITDELKEFIEEQPLFFVATAPVSAQGHVNLSPKGVEGLKVLSPNRVAYLDLTGSGNETSAHLGENGRITFMFCAFSGRPRILRLYGRGKVVLPGAPGWDELIALFSPQPGIRQIITAEISRIQTSCGFGVPLMETRGQRDMLGRWAEAKGDELPSYREKYNAVSIDGLPAPLTVGTGVVRAE